MKILITGSNGQLGQELQDILKTGRAEIGPVDPAWQNCCVDAVDVDRLDITNSRAVTEYLLASAPDAVINCAAMTNVNGCESAREAAMRVNALGPRNLAAACKLAGAKLVQVSTDYVFDGNGSVQSDGSIAPYTEWDVLNPLGIYGKSKALGEQYALQQCERTFVVRTAWLFGYKGKNFVKTMLALGRSKGAVTVVNDQFGNPTHANDLAYTILRLLLTEEYGIYHCTGGGICSWYEFACRIMEKGGVNAVVTPCTTREYPTPAKRPAYSALDHCMLRCTVGDEMRPWQDALDAYLQNMPVKAD